MPIPGTTKAHRLQENLGATTIELTDDERREIQEAAEQVKILGDRYLAQMQQTIYTALFLSPPPPPRFLWRHAAQLLTPVRRSASPLTAR